MLESFDLISISYRRLGKILNIPFEGLDLNDTKMIGESILAKNFLPCQSLLMQNNNIQHLTRIIAHLFAYKIYH